MSAATAAALTEPEAVGRCSAQTSKSGLSRVQNDFDAAVLFIPELFVELRTITETAVVRDVKGGIDFAFNDQAYEFRQIMLNRRLRHAKCLRAAPSKRRAAISILGSRTAQS